MIDEKIAEVKRKLTLDPENHGNIMRHFSLLERAGRAGEVQHMLLRINDVDLKRKCVDRFKNTGYKFHMRKDPETRHLLATVIHKGNDLTFCLSDSENCMFSGRSMRYSFIESSIESRGYRVPTLSEAISLLHAAKYAGRVGASTKSILDNWIFTSTRIDYEREESESMFVNPTIYRAEDSEGVRNLPNVPLKSPEPYSDRYIYSFAREEEDLEYLNALAGEEGFLKLMDLDSVLNSTNKFFFPRSANSIALFLHPHITAISRGGLERGISFGVVEPTSETA